MGWFTTTYIDYRVVSIFTLLMILFANWMLRGFAFKKLMSTYLGFVPFVGGPLCTDRIAEAFSNPYRARYKASVWALGGAVLILLFSGVIWSFFLALFALAGALDWMISMDGGAQAGLAHQMAPEALILMSLLWGLILAILLSFGISRYYRYRLLKPALQKMDEAEPNRLALAAFAILPTAFYIRVLTKEFADISEYFAASRKI